MPSVNKNTRTSFEKSSAKTADQIKAACAEVKKSNKSKFQIDCNGNHIWLKMGLRQFDFWSPMLHVELGKSNGNRTHVKGTYGQNPFLWVLFLCIRIACSIIFAGAAFVSWYKWDLGFNFDSELLVMFAMVSVWFALYFISEWSKKKGARQIAELHDFMDHLVE